MSYTFNADGKCTSFTGGYVMDRRVGNTQGLGAMFGILAAIGGPVLKPGSPTFMMLALGNAITTTLKGKAAAYWLSRQLHQQLIPSFELPYTTRCPFFSNVLSP